MISPNDLEWFAARLSIAVHDTRKETHEMLIHEMREALRDIPGYENLSIEFEPTGHQKITIGDKVLEVGPMASNAEIVAALQNPFIPTANTKIKMAKSPLAGVGQKLGLLKHNAELDAAKIAAKVDELDARRQAAVPKVMDGLDAQGQDIGELETFVTDLEKVTNQ